MFSARNNSSNINHQDKSAFGFTIIELLIVIVVMILLFTVGVANLRDYQRRKVLDSAVTQFKSHLRLAQQMALSGRKPADCTTANIALEGVRFQRNSSTTYSIDGRCTNGNYYTYNLSYSLQPNYEGITISNSTVEFLTLGRGIYGNSDVTFTLTQTSSGTSKNIVVTKGGEIK